MYKGKKTHEQIWIFLKCSLLSYQNDPEKKTFYWLNEYEIEIYEAALSDNRVYVWRQDCFLHYCKIQKFAVKKKGGGCKMARDLQETFFLFTLIISFKWEWYSRILDSGQVSTWSRIKISIVQEKVQNLRQCGLKCNLQCNTTIRCRKNRIERR